MEEDLTKSLVEIVEIVIMLIILACVPFIVVFTKEKKCEQ